MILGISAFLPNSKWKIATYLNVIFSINGRERPMQQYILVDTINKHWNQHIPTRDNRLRPQFP